MAQMVKRIRPGLYHVTLTIEDEPITFTVERCERGDTDYPSDVGLWSVSTPRDRGEPWYRTLREALEVLTPDQWHFHPEFGLCAR